MKKISLYFLLPMTIFAFQACNEDKTTEIKKNGSVETSIMIEHLNDSLDVVITTHKIWVHQKLIKSYAHCDTLPGLGMTTQEAENNEGQTQQVSMKKDYELYVTVE